MDFKIGALTVDPQVASYDPSSLIPYMEELGVEYLYKERDKNLYVNHKQLYEVKIFYLK